MAGPKVVEVLSGTTALTGASAFTFAENIAMAKNAAVVALWIIPASFLAFIDLTLPVLLAILHRLLAARRR
ncbi:MAG TPA: hypothetical protein VL027_03770, partial [Spongiibacteraceae bacterium]|nr:hypothetical protein [Spongiibacteraceae bacterium]